MFSEYLRLKDLTASDRCRPDPYLLGAKRAGVDPARCLVVEDAPAGVRSGKAAGCKTLGLITSHTREQLEEVKPDWLVPNLAR